MRTNKISAVVVVALMAVCMSGFAAEPKGWQFETAIYGWYAGLEGDVAVRRHTADFDKSPSDMLDAAEFAATLLGVAQYDRYLILGQVDSFSLTTDELSADDQPNGGSLDTKEFLGELAVGYQLDGFAAGQRCDVLLGVRNLTMDNELEVFGAGTFSKKVIAYDPVLILRPSLPVLPSMVDGLRFSMIMSIGAGGDANLLYELFPELQYVFSNNVSARLGYRLIGYEFDGDGNDNELDFRQSGVIAGVGVIF